MPPEIRTRATLRSAEFGFFGVVVYTRVHTPRRWGAATFFLRPLPDFRPGVDSFFGFAVRPFRTSWLVVGMRRRMLAARPLPAVRPGPRVSEADGARRPAPQAGGRAAARAGDGPRAGGDRAGAARSAGPGPARRPPGAARPLAGAGRRRGRRGADP